MQIIRLDDAFTRFSEQWRPKVIAQLNGQAVKLVRVEGVFPWHSHADEDEMFLVWQGSFRVELRGKVFALGPGEMVVVPRGVEHRTAADQEALVMIFEPLAVRNTGNVAGGAFLAPTDAWLDGVEPSP